MEQNFNIGDIVCFADPTVRGGGRPLAVSQVAETTLCARIIKLGMPLAYTIPFTQAVHLAPSPVGKLTRLSFHHEFMMKFERIAKEVLQHMEEQNLLRPPT